MSNKYILEGKEAVCCKDTLEWAKWYQTADRIVAEETIGDSSVSTIFLGLDYSFGDGPPLLFETQVFGGKLSDEMDRYSTWDEAVLGHKTICERIKEGR